ncbi:MAG TPA: hypothetical protein VF412_19310 [Bdellovibrio sp.]|uniref:hypothetical protein n=1 Tax=Bdellovibrio sp. TaxID=28201 RepID=UPI002F1AAF26
MSKNDILKTKYSTLVSQTIDSPITVLDFWELSDVFIGLFIILIFGVLFYSWGTMIVLLSVFLGAGPIVKRRYPKGIFLHWPYANFQMELPGLVNPKGKKRKYSD